ncbi:hypothetical protein SSP35_21_00840 [Streptomyces sp. NBRC 110611]|uniref:DUF4253 domain-containing protein n=1 Tax=Streptomyces sp. NBRC 110611 TaxID=1621259 RepID=UPI0008583E41|nr:DUF4253 domain-containing protein [Streptomyces sp. NBRC 110611]GAU70689.1 hypothetical protein SSP35_21_00840 [Streptomyces sp. NBRC 110611]
MTLTAEQLPRGLPPGRLVVPDAQFAGPAAPNPVLWVSEKPLPEAEAGPRWGELLRQHRVTGLWPLLLGALTDTHGTTLRPWHNGELAPMPTTAPDEVNVAELCAVEWEDLTEEGLQPVPYPAWPGMAPPAEPEGDPDQRAVALAGSREAASALLPGSGHGPYLGLVAAPDGATALTTCGWRPEVGAETIAAMVRSWQHRFGARLCALGGVATLALTVAWPPRSREHARHVAAEHVAFCPDLLQLHDFETYAAALVDAPVWTLWWD